MTALPSTPSFRLDGKRAIVTGAGRGIGVGLATALAKAGAQVCLVARSLDQVDAVAQALRSEGADAFAHAIDVCDLKSVSAFFASHEPFDILINNAGTNRPKPILDATPDDFDAVFNLNVRAAYFVTQAFAQRLIEARRGGSVIHISSQMGQVGGPNRSLYCGSKWAVEGMNKAIALDLAAHDIRSNTIAPTFIKTPLTEPYFEDADFKASVLSKIKLGRLGEVEDLMGAALFLASDASSMMTGSTITIDGGWTAE